MNLTNMVETLFIGKKKTYKRNKRIKSLQTEQSSRNDSLKSYSCRGQSQQEESWQRQTTKYVVNGLLPSLPCHLQYSSLVLYINFTLCPFLSVIFFLLHSLIPSLCHSLLLALFCLGSVYNIPSHPTFAVFTEHFSLAVFSLLLALYLPSSLAFTFNISLRLSVLTVTISGCNSLRKSKGVQCSTMQEEIMCYVCIQIYCI